MFAPYRPGSGPFYRASAGVKLALLAGVGTGLFLIDNPAAMVGAALGALALFPLAGLPLADARAQLRPVALMVAILVVVQALVVDFASAILVGARLVVLLLCAGLVTLTTRTSAMIETLERALSPLRHFGVETGGVALAISLAVRFIPLIAQVVAEVREAQRLRGLEHNILALAIPALVRTLRMSYTIADAIEARGHPRSGRSDCTG